MSEIVWEDPEGRTDWTSIAATLKSRPGSWARIKEVSNGQQAGTTRGRIKRGDIAAFSPAGSFDSAVRKLDSGSYGIYARYVGEDAS